MSRRILPALRSSAHLVAGLALAIVPGLGHAQDTRPIPGDDPVTEEPLGDADAIAGEAAVFARFADLDDQATLDQLVALTSSDTSAELLYAVSSILGRDDVTASMVEGLLGALVAGLEEADADRTLAAVMRDYYDSSVRGSFASGAMGVNDVFDAMETRAEVVVTAVYGSAEAHHRGSLAARTLRHKRRRI